MLSRMFRTIWSMLPLSFFSNPASGRTSVNGGNIEKQVPRPSEEGHGARSGELDVGRCGHAARVVTAVHSFTAVGACPRTAHPQHHPEGASVAVRMFGSLVIGIADPSFVHKCASDSITCQRFELWADVGESEVAKRRGSGAGWPGRVGERWNEGVGRLIVPEAPVVAVRMLGSIVHILF